MEIKRWSNARRRRLEFLISAQVNVADAHPEVVAAAALTGYGAVFAITSSLHSWLVVAMHDDDRAPLNRPLAAVELAPPLPAVGERGEKGWPASGESEPSGRAPGRCTTTPSPVSWS